jgi:hypothetical protein
MSEQPDLDPVIGPPAEDEAVEPTPGQRMLSEVRPHPGAPGGVIRWSPVTDVRSCGMEMIRNGIVNVSMRRWEPWISQLLALHEVTDDDLAAMCEQFARGFGGYLGDTRKDLGDYLKEAGFFAAHPAARMVLGFLIGQQAVGMVAHSLPTGMFLSDSGVTPYHVLLTGLLRGAESAAEDLVSTDASPLARMNRGISILMGYGPDGTVELNRYQGRVGVVLDTPVSDKDGAKLVALGWTLESDRNGVKEWLF